MPRRPELLATSVRRIIASVLRECPPKCGIVSITDVVISPDLSFVTISVAALEHPELAIQFLEGRQRELQKNLVVLSTHRIPKLRFQIDRRSERGSRIDQLLEDASRTTPADAQEDAVED